MKAEYGRFIEYVLPLLRCPACHSNQLDLTQDGCEFNLSFPLHREFLRCYQCGEDYPITEDIIPIMWTKPLKVHIMGQSQDLSVLGANVDLYEAISSDYEKNSRRDPVLAKRIQNSARRIINSEDTNGPKYHLDFGCGPGHVLSWLNEFNFLQVGLDVSLNNLRSTRKNTGGLVVCGDASNMPFSDNTFELVTASSVLHHVEDWISSVIESCRICKKSGGVLIDSEPSKETMDWGPLAVFLYKARIPFYRLTHFIRRNEYFCNRQRIKHNIMAEFHASPGSGLSLDMLKCIFERADYSVDIILSPNEHLKSEAKPDLKNIVLSLLSGRNPWNPKYGCFTAIAKPQSVQNP